MSSKLSREDRIRKIAEVIILESLDHQRAILAAMPVQERDEIINEMKKKEKK